MAYPALIKGKRAADYRSYFKSIYCRGPVRTFDGIDVRFSKRDFNHAFFESVTAKDDTFSTRRAERVLWIKAALQDANAELRVGWDNKKKRSARDRRVAVVQQNYVVVIRVTKDIEATFVTAFIADEAALRKIRTNPLWK